MQSSRSRMHAARETMVTKRRYGWRLLILKRSIVKTFSPPTSLPTVRSPFENGSLFFIVVVSLRKKAQLQLRFFPSVFLWSIFSFSFLLLFDDIINDFSAAKNSFDLLNHLSIFFTAGGRSTYPSAIIHILVPPVCLENFSLSEGFSVIFFFVYFYFSSFEYHLFRRFFFRHFKDNPGKFINFPNRRNSGNYAKRIPLYQCCCYYY